jgi:hypothetical protein
VAGPGSGGGSPAGQDVAVGAPRGQDTVVSVDLGSIDPLGYEWLVPGALLGLPGLLLLLIIGAQAGLAGVFVPLTGRALAGQERPSEA